MPAEDAERPAGGAAAIGFHSYADDTLRTSPGATPPPRREAWDDAWDQPEADAAAWPGEPPKRRASRGAAVALTLALLAGAAVALAWSLTPSGRAPLRAAASAPAAPTQAPQPLAPAEARPLRAASRVMVAQTQPPPVRPGGARSATAAAPPRAAVQPDEAPGSRNAGGRDPIGERLAALSLAPAPLAPPPAAEPQAAPAAVTPPPAAADCADAQTAARRMVCEDPELAAADRRMARAYRAAIAAGAPERQLRAEQQDWLDVREDAARRSRRAVASIYAQRIDDLLQWRDEAAARNPDP